jgi:pimeloyl-ACP methyl ester carboxylesterase
MPKKTFLNAPEKVFTMTLADGRRLAYAEYGDPAGTPVLFFHGWGDSRLTRHPDDRLTADLGVRLIAIDRPGIGGSDFKPGRTLLDWPEDVRQLMDALGLGTAAILAHSGGCPYALACAARLPERFSRVGIVSGLAPLDRPGGTDGLALWMRLGSHLFRRWPWTARAVFPPLPLWAYARLERFIAVFYERLSMPPGDRGVMALPGVREMFMRAGGENMRQGTQGTAQDLYLVFGRPWGFQPAECKLPLVLWYGDADHTAPASMGRYLASQVKGSRLMIYPGEGHLMFIARWADILAVLANP